jgi:hypothetical protein
MNTRALTVIGAFVVFIVLLWVSYLRTEKATGSGYKPPSGTEKFGLVGVDKPYNGLIYTSNYLSAWAPDWKRAPDGGNPTYCTKAMKLKDGRFIQVGYNSGGFWASNKLSNSGSDWKPLAGSGSDVLQLHDGTFAVCGGGGTIFTSQTLTAENRFVRLPGSGSSRRLIQLQDGTFVATGGDYKLYTSTILTNDNAFWKATDGRDSWNDIKQLRDGTFVAIDANWNICTCPRLSGNRANWTALPDKSIRARSLFIYYE